MILSIGMIVKNEEKILRRCLEGLRPILENIRSELIIYDTGSDDATMDIAREFTPHVFEIEWRKDFAWARNHTVRRAKGQWYMYVDADEVFEDCSDLIEFFKSGEYRKFKSAGYRLRNHQADGSIGFFSPARLFKLDKNTKFVGKIHEGIAPNPPTKILESVADHYGYAFADADDIKQKHQRNIHALLEDFNEENPKSIRTVTHIIAEYTAMGDLDKIGEFLTIGRNLVGDNQNDMHYHIYASRWAEYLINTEKLAEAVDFIRQYFSDLKVVEQNVVALRNVEGVALQRLGRHKEAGDAFAQAIRLFEHNQRGEIRTGMTKLTSMQADMLEDKSKHLSGAVANYALAGEFEAAYTFAEEMQGKSIDIAYVYAANGVVNQLWDNFPKLYAYGLQCGAGSERYDNAVAAIERVVKSGAIREQMGLAFSKWADNEGSDDDYTRLWRLRLEDTNALGYFLSAEREFSQVYGDVLVAAIKQGRDFDGFLEKMKITDTAELAARIIRSNADIADILLDLLEDIPAAISVKFARVVCAIAAAAYDEILARDDDFKIRYFRGYIRLRHRFLSMIYRDDIYCEAGAMALAEQDAFAFFAGRGYECADNGDMAGFAQNLRLALRSNPHMKDIVNLVVKNLTSRQAQTNTAAGQLSNEIAALKKIIHTMIQAGNPAKAAEILNSYAAINPTDPEIPEITKAIEAIT